MFLNRTDVNDDLINKNFKTSSWSGKLNTNNTMSENNCNAVMHRCNKKSQTFTENKPRNLKERLYVQLIEANVRHTLLVLELNISCSAFLRDFLQTPRGRYCWLREGSPLRMLFIFTFIYDVIWCVMTLFPKWSLTPRFGHWNRKICWQHVQRSACLMFYEERRWS